MHDDPIRYRMIAYGLVMLCVMCLTTLERIPLVVMIPTLGFVFWRWWEQRTRRGEYWAVRLWRKWRKKPEALVERKGDS